MYAFYQTDVFDWCVNVIASFSTRLNTYRSKRRISIAGNVIISTPTNRNLVILGNNRSPFVRQKPITRLLLSAEKRDNCDWFLCLFLAFCADSGALHLNTFGQQIFALHTLHMLARMALILFLANAKTIWGRIFVLFYFALHVFSSDGIYISIGQRVVCSLSALSL